jgi:hypothetical protein
MKIFDLISLTVLATVVLAGVASVLFVFVQALIRLPNFF